MTRCLSKKVGNGFSVRQVDKRYLPELRFPEFEGEWEEKRLDAFAPLQRGFDLPTTQVKDGISPVVYSNGILRTHSEYRVKGPGVVTGRSGTIGKVHYVEEDFWPHNTSLWVTSFFENLPTFVYQFYANLGLERIGTGSGVPTLNRNDVHALKRHFPKPDEQKKIADFLGVVDAKIAAFRDRQAGLERYKRGLMQAMFNRHLRFTKPDSTPFPDWEEKQLGEVFEEVMEKVGDQDLLTYSISAGKGWVSQKEKFGKDISGQQNERYTALRVGDFAYNKGNSKSYKFGCVYPNDTGETIAVPNVFISFRSISTETSVRFYAKLFENHFLDRGLRKIISSGARMDGLLNVNKTYFFKLGLPQPHPDEQQKIADSLSAIDVKIQAVAGQVDRMTTFKKGLLQQMFV